MHNLQDQINLTVLLGQVAQAKGISGFQATRDTTDLLNGQASRTMLGRELGIKDEDIKKAKEAGTVMQFLTEKLSAYAEAGKLGADTFSGSMQTVKNELEQLAGAASKPIFDQISEFLREIKKPLGGAGVTGAVGGFAETLSVLAEESKKTAPRVQEVWSYVSRLKSLVETFNPGRVLFQPLFESSALAAQVDAQNKVVLSLQSQIEAAKTQAQVSEARKALEDAITDAVERTTSAPLAWKSRSSAKTPVKSGWRFARCIRTWPPRRHFSPWHRLVRLSA